MVEALPSAGLHAGGEPDEAAAALVPTCVAAAAFRLL